MTLAFESKTDLPPDSKRTDSGDDAAKASRTRLSGEGTQQGRIEPQVKSANADTSLPSLTLTGSRSDTVAQTYESLNKAINGSWFGADSSAIERILNATSASDRAQLEGMYAKDHGTPLRASLLKKLGDGVTYRTIESIMDRQDGKTNDAGNVRVALETDKENPSKGGALLRATLLTLSGDDFSAMKKNFADRYKMSFDQAVNQSTGLSAQDRSLALSTEVSKGVKDRTAADVEAMARESVDARDLKMFADVVGGDYPAASDARAKLSADPAFKQKFDSTFIAGADQTQAQIAKDLLSEGHVSLATIASGNKNVLFGFLDNDSGLDIAVKHATDKERQEFSVGRELTRDHKPEQQMNDSERAAKQYFSKIDQALKAGSNERQTAISADELEHGRSTLISDLAEQHSEGHIFGLIGAGHTTDSLMSQVENLSRQDYDLLTNPKTRDQFRTELQESLKSYATPHEQERILKLVDAKTTPAEGRQQPPSYEESQSIRRSLSEVLDDNKSDSKKVENVAAAITHMSAADAAKYKTDEAFRKQVDEVFSNGRGGFSDAAAAASILGPSLLHQVGETGQPPTLGPVDKFVQGVLTGSTDASQRKSEAVALLQDPALRDRLQKVYDLQERGLAYQASPADVSLNMLLKNSILSSGGAMSDGAWKSYLKNQEVPLGYQIAADGGALHQSLYGKYGDIAALPESQRNVRHQLMSPEQREILDQVVAKNGKPDLVDRIRSFVIGDGGTDADFRDELAAVKKRGDKDVTAMLDAYAQRYHGNMANDFLSKIPSSDAIEFGSYLSKTRDGKEEYDQRVGQLADASGIHIDASKEGVERTVQLNASALETAQVENKPLTADQQTALSQQYSDSMQNYQQSKERLANATIDAGFWAAAGASVVLSDGLATPLVGALGGTVLEPAARKVIQGNDLTNTGLLGSAAKGAFDGFLIGLPAAKGAAAVGENTAAREGAQAAENGVVRAETSAAEKGVAEKAAAEKAAAEKAAAEKAAAEKAAAEKAAAEKAAAEKAAAEKAAAEKAAAEKAAAEKAAAEKAAAEKAAAEKAAAEKAAAEKAAAEKAAAEKAAAEKAAAEKAAAEKAAAEKAAAEKAAGQTVAGAATEAVPAEARALQAGGAAARSALNRVGTVAAIGAAEQAPALAAPPEAPPPVSKEEMIQKKFEDEHPEISKVLKQLVPGGVPSELLMELATVRLGEGPYQSAQRVLRAAMGHRPEHPDVMLLTRAMQREYKREHNGNGDMSSLKVRHHFLTDENFSRTVNDVNAEDIRHDVYSLASQGHQEPEHLAARRITTTKRRYHR